jgi:hypothetical protein
MSKRIGLHIGGRRFDVDVEEGFSTYLQAQMTKDFNLDGNNDLKLLLQAYVRKNHELFLQEQKLQEVLKNIEEKF